METDSRYEHLDAIAVDIAKEVNGSKERLGVLSTGEQLYVALAASRSDVLDSLGYTIAEAIERLGPDWTTAWLERWRYCGNPKNFS
jgi:hypothetical protein